MDLEAMKKRAQTWYPTTKLQEDVLDLVAEVERLKKELEELLEPRKDLGGREK